MLWRMSKNPSTLSPNLERLSIMKKLYIALAVLVTAALASCQQEKDTFMGHKVGENEIAFTLNSTATRSMEVNSAVRTGNTFLLGTDGIGDALFFEESIEELNGGPETKGTPAYTANVGTLYPELGVYAEDLGDTSYELFGEGEGWHYYHNYVGRPWPDDPDEKIDFYLRMPATMSGLSNAEYANKKITFDFEPLPTAAEQDDILFSQVSISKNIHYSHISSGGVPVTMYHALTGVKFRVGNDNSGSTKTIITQVKFTGLKGTGHCEIDDEGNITWNPGTSTAYTYTQKFTNPDYTASLGAQNPDGSVTYTKPTEGDAPFGDSWYAPGKDTNNPTNTQNLNMDDGSYTFWFIPQTMTDAVKLEVTFVVKTPDTPGTTGGGVITHTIDFGKALPGVEWKAGQLRTYTLVPKEVDVEIEDTMEGLSKTNLHIANTGNVAEYVRMTIVGNWYGWETEASQKAGDEPSILVGYKTDGSKGDNDNEMVTPWFLRDEEFGQYFDETFTNGIPQGENDWIRGDGGYYYPTPIGPGEEMASGTTALFSSYVWPSDVPFPTIYIPTNTSNVRVPAWGVHLIMEVVIQAIGTTKPDGTPYASCWEAWTAAVYPDGGGTIAPKN